MQLRPAKGKIMTTFYIQVFKSTDLPSSDIKANLPSGNRMLNVNAIASKVRPSAGAAERHSEEVYIDEFKRKLRLKWKVNVL